MQADDRFLGLTPGPSDLADKDPLRHELKHEVFPSELAPDQRLGQGEGHAPMVALCVSISKNTHEAGLAGGQEMVWKLKRSKHGSLIR